MANGGSSRSGGDSLCWEETEVRCTEVARWADELRCVDDDRRCDDRDRYEDDDLARRSVCDGDGLRTACHCVKGKVDSKSKDVSQGARATQLNAKPRSCNAPRLRFYVVCPVDRQLLQQPSSQDRQNGRLLCRRPWTRGRMRSWSGRDATADGDGTPYVLCGCAADDPSAWLRG